MLLVRIIPLFEANRYCGLILKWSLNEGMPSFMVYKQANVSRHLGCLFQICMTNILIWFSFSATLPNLLFALHFRGFSQPLALGSFVTAPWLLTVGECWSESDRNRCPSWPSLFTSARSEAGYWISLSRSFLTYKISNTLNITNLLSLLWIFLST